MLMLKSAFKSIACAAILVASALALITVQGAVRSVFGRQQGESAPSSSFEIASIKPDPSPQPNLIIQTTPNLVRVELSTIELMRFVYNVRDFQIIGMPSRLSSKIYIIEAKPDASMAEKLSLMPYVEREAQSKLMLQSLLADRFGLKIHHETKDVPSFDLIVAKAGRLRESQTDCKSRPTSPPPGPASNSRPLSCGAFNGLGHIAGLDMRISQLASFLTFRLQQTVTEKTGLSGNYDIVLDWAPDVYPTQPAQPDAPVSQPDTNAPSLQTALEEQLGLKLVSTKTPTDFIVIDHIDEPLPN